jgi:sporulation protein YlmC with PRC-barrel domain
MKKFLLIVCFFCLLTGFGIFPEDETKIPDVITNFKIILTDTDGYHIEVTNVTINSNLYLSGKYNKGDMIIPFKDIQKIIFNHISEKKSEAKIFLKNNETINVIIDNNLKLKGKSKYGIYSIPLKDVREIVITGTISNKKE